MSYCPKCVADGDEKRDGDVEYCRKCHLVMLGAFVVENGYSEVP